MIRLQAMMVFPFFLLVLQILFLVLSLSIILIYNYLQDKINDKNPRYIPWYWIIILSFLMMVILIIYISQSDILKYT